MTYNEMIGSRIRTVRKSLGMTQEELAVKAGFTSKSTINKIELGQRGIRLSRLEAIASSLGVTAMYIMGLDDKETAEITDSLPSEYYALPEEQKALVAQMIHTLADRSSD